MNHSEHEPGIRSVYHSRRFRCNEIVRTSACGPRNLAVKNLPAGHPLRVYTLVEIDKRMEEAMQLKDVRMIVCFMSGLLIFSIWSPNFSLAQGAPAQPTLEGSWTSTVTFINRGTGAPPRSFPSMNNFMQGGTMSEFGLGSVPIPRAPGFGVWSHAGGQNYLTQYQFFCFNADGSANGTVRARRDITLTNFGTEFFAASTIQFFDNNGARLRRLRAAQPKSRGVFHNLKRSTQC